MNLEHLNKLIKDKYYVISYLPLDTLQQHEMKKKMVWYLFQLSFKKNTERVNLI